MTDGPARKLNVFFDVDYTLIDRGILRPHTREVFERLTEAGHSIYIWSGVGIRRWDIQQHDLQGFVTDYYVKPLARYRERLSEFNVPIVPDFVIDDHKTVVDDFDAGYHIKDYWRDSDTELLKVLEAIEALAAQRAGEPSTAEEQLAP